MTSGIYRQGTDFERRVAAYYHKGGWVVIRSAGSHGPVDLVCAKGGEIQLVQCKAGDGYLRPAERIGLLETAKEFGGTAWVAEKTLQGHIRMVKVEG